jgi:lipid A 3-O-deacylase
MRGRIAAILAVCGLAVGQGIGASPARADDPAFISFAAGYFDWNRQKNEAAEFRLEYRGAEKYWIFKPLGGVMATSDKGLYVFAGVGIDVFLGRRVVITPSFAPGYYRKGDGLDLGHELEFRSHLEIAYRFDNRSRLGVAVSHMSNASIGDTNPGTEAAMVYYSIPISTLFGK